MTLLFCGWGGKYTAGPSHLYMQDRQEWKRAEVSICSTPKCKENSNAEQIDQMVQNHAFTLVVYSS